MPELTAPPLATRCFFSFGSVWILVLGVDAWAKSVMLSLLLVATSVSSFLHWSFFRYNSRLSLLDRFCASLVFVYVFVRGSGWVHHALGYCSIAAFLLGNHAIMARNWDHHLHFHSLFRYCAYWMILVYCRPVEWYEVIFFSVVSGPHHMCISLWLIGEVNHMANGGYPRPVNVKG